DSSQGGPDGPSGEQWVTIGHELVDVIAGDDSLVIDKGSQRVEIRVVGAEVPDDAAAPASHAPAPHAPAPHAPAPHIPADDVSILESYAPGLEAVATAPMYQNAAVLGAKLFGETRLEVV